MLFLYLTIHTSNVYKYSLQYFNSPAVKYYFDISEEGNVRFFEVNLKDGILNKYKNINRTSVTPEDYHNLNFLKLLTLRARVINFV